MRNKGLYSMALSIGTNTIYLLSFLFLLLNFSSGIIGGIWILISGGWELLIIGLLLSVFMPWAYSLAFLPQLAALPFLNKAIEKRSRLWVGLLGFGTNLYGNVVIVYWTFFIFNLFISYQTDYAVIPLLLLGYSVALSPLQYMAQKEGPDSGGSILGVLLSQVSYVALSLVLLLGWLPNISIPLTIAFVFSLFISIITAMSVEKQSYTESINGSGEFCGKCGKSKGINDNFCTSCGYQFNQL